MLAHSLGVVFETTTDDKDQNDVVSITALSGGQVVGTSSLGSKTKWDNFSTVGPFGLWFTQEQPLETSHLEFRISKTGTDGWDFNVTVTAHGPGGMAREVLLYAALAFKDSNQSFTTALNA
jgi:hypothetical protein